MQVRTKGNASPQGKSRVFFTCHPDDWDRSFEKILEDVFSTADPAVYYIDSEKDDISNEKLLENDLRQMSLFIIPVSFKLLMERGFTMDYAVPFAKREHIPILTIMLEPGLDPLYAKDENFGTLQYLDPNVTDETAISYKKKLQDYLNSVLIGDELAERVRKAFDAYVFLSYRKKDRAYANDLMRLIHKDLMCRDIAIWYDEFLTPGEAFDEAIADAMKKSELFTLLVTPNLVNERNYVQTEEYPRAKKADLNILPVEVVDTDRRELEEKYPGIPECVKKEDEDDLRERFLANINRIERTENDDDPEHNYLIGLAYLDGIDVEVDTERAVELISVAADAYLPEAMGKLAEMYNKGIGVNRNILLALKWYEKYVNYYETHSNGDDVVVLKYQNILATLYSDCGQYDKAIDLSQKVYDLNKRIFGENNPDTLTSLNNLAKEYSDKDDMFSHMKALKLHEQVYEARKLTLGEEHPDTLTSLDNLAFEYGATENHKKALQLHKKAYEIRKRVLGEDNPYTLTSLNNLGKEYDKTGNPKKALDLFKLAYECRKKVLGSDHPDTLRSLNNLAYEYGSIGNHQKALDLYEKEYSAGERVLGEEHPDVIRCLGNLANEYSAIGNHKKAVNLLEQVLEANNQLFGEEHPRSINILNNLAMEYSILGRHKEAVRMLERVNDLSKFSLKKESADALNYLCNLAFEYGEVGEHFEAIGLFERAYSICKRVLGETHPFSLEVLKHLAQEYGKTRNHIKSKELFDNLMNVNRQRK